MPEKYFFVKNAILNIEIFGNMKGRAYLCNALGQ